MHPHTDRNRERRVLAPRFSAALAVCLATAGISNCLSHDTTRCSFGVVCPAGKVCDENNEKCVLPQHIATCIGEEQWATCDYAGSQDGTCYNGVCHVFVCGNRIEDPGEVCDDGNTESGDGCSGDCQSDESCPNSIVDSARREECDDGNRVSHDGCSSGCMLEQPTWTSWTSPWVGRRSLAMTYDSQRQRIVLFGGVSGAYALDDTWEHDGTRWFKVTPNHSPTARSRHGMAYDPVRERTVLMGGYDGTRTLSDTWEYDGADWHLMAPENSPSPTMQHAMAYDHARNRVTVFGGNDGNDRVSITWLYDGQTWTAATPPLSPPPRSDARMVYADSLQGLVLFAGSDAPNYLGDTWLFDGTEWHNITPAGVSPSNRSAHALAYDSVRDLVVMFGGFPDPGPEGETWEFDGQNWDQADPTRSPIDRWNMSMVFDPVQGVCALLGGLNPPIDYDETWAYDGTTWNREDAQPLPTTRRSQAMAYDSARARTVLFGGHTDEGGFILRTGTWEFDGDQWILSEPDPSPPSRTEHTMAYDPVREVTVLFGGWGNGIRNDTWEFDGATWREITPPDRPDPRHFHAMVYDPGRRVMVLFGGQNNGYLNDTWEFDGATWSPIATADAPTPRSGHEMVFDAFRNRVVLFGGFGGHTGPNAGYATGTWEYDGTNWREVLFPPNQQTPVLRDFHAMAYDPVRALTVLFGGHRWDGYDIDLDDVWTFDGTDWVQEIQTGAVPAARDDHSMVFDTANRRILLFGGRDFSQYYAEVWFYQLGSSTPNELCTDDSDNDHDGLTDCADLDCSTHPACF